MRTLIGFCNFLVLAESNCTSPTQVAFDLIDLNTGTRVFTEAGDLQSSEGVAVQAIAFEMAINWNYVRFAVDNTTQSYNPCCLKQLARFFMTQRSHHVRGLPSL
jgi:hypothetical protein